MTNGGTDGTDRKRDKNLIFLWNVCDACMLMKGFLDSSGIFLLFDILNPHCPLSIVHCPQVLDIGQCPTSNTCGSKIGKRSTSRISKLFLNLFCKLFNVNEIHQDREQRGAWITRFLHFIEDGWIVMDWGWMKSVDNLNPFISIQVGPIKSVKSYSERQHVFQSDKALLLFVKYMYLV